MNDRMPPALSDADMEYYLAHGVDVWDARRCSALRAEALRARHHEWRRGILLEEMIDALEDLYVISAPFHRDTDETWAQFKKQYERLLLKAREEIGE